MPKTKPLYHSQLRDIGRTTLRFKTDPTDGKYGPYCFVQLKDQEEDRLFNIDSDMVGDEIVRTRKSIGNGWVEVEASGGKEDATIRVMSPGTEGPVFPGDEPQGTPPGGPGPHENGAGSTGIDQTVQSTLRAVQGLEKGGVRVDSDAAARIFSTIYIQTHR